MSYKPRGLELPYMRVGTALCLLSILDEVCGGDLQRTIDKPPVLVCMGTADTIIPHSSVRNFFDGLRAPDKTFMSYEGALHGLVSEPEPMRTRIVSDITQWLDARL